MMLRLITLSCMLMAALSDNGAPEFDKAFENMDENPKLSQIKCSNMEGNLPGCYECYLCDHEKVREKRIQGIAIYDMTLVDGECKSTQVCCISQKNLIYREAGAKCGAPNPDGSPFRLRNRLKQVLPGEYPWRAWVYSKDNPSRPLCSATYVSFEARALIAPANCVHTARPESLVVRFSKNTQYPQDVGHLVVHPKFNADTHENDLAFLSLKNHNIPEWAEPACLPANSLPFASTCSGVSDDDNYINFVIPQQSQCDEVDPQLPISVMCAVSPPGDYRQEYGGGLFCLNNDVKKPTYTVHGIMLHRSGDVVSLYANISNFKHWIDDTIIQYS